MATAVSLRTVFTSSTSGLVSGANTASACMKKLAKDVSGMRGSLGTLKTIAIGQVFAQVGSAAISAGRSFFAFGQSTAEAIDSQSKLARRLGLTYGQMAGLKLAAVGAGLSVESVASAATRADLAFIDASSGTQDAIDKFTDLKLSMADMQKMSPEQRFAAIAEAISKLPTAAERSAAAVKMFGKSGAELMPLFEQGAAGIRKATDEAQKFGLTLNNAQGAGVEKMMSSFGSAFSAIQGIATQVVSNLAEPISRIIDDFTTFVGESGAVDIGKGISTALIDGAIFVVEMFGVAANVIYANFIEPFGSATGALIAAFDKGAGVANVFLGVGNLLLAMFQKIAANFAALSSIFLSAASGVADMLGFKDTADSLAAMASSMSDSSKSLVADSGKSMKAAGENFAAAVDGAASKKISGAPTGNSVADAITKSIRDGRAAAEAARNTPDAAAAQIDPAALRMKADAELRAKQKTAAEKIGNDTAKDNPLQTFRDSLSTLQEALAGGAISQEDFNKRFANIQADLVAANQDALDAQAAQDGVSRQAVSGVDATSTAGVSEFFRLMRGAEPPGLKEQRQVAEDTKKLREIAEAGSKGLPVPVQLMPKGA